jgi:alkylhydroperoxidase family enzyme
VTEVTTTAVGGLETYVRANVDRTLLELVKLRASMLNGCADLILAIATINVWNRIGVSTRMQPAG